MHGEAGGKGEGAPRQAEGSGPLPRLREARRARARLLSKVPQAGKPRDAESPGCPEGEGNLRAVWGKPRFQGRTLRVVLPGKPGAEPEPPRQAAGGGPVPPLRATRRAAPERLCPALLPGTRAGSVRAAEEGLLGAAGQPALRLVRQTPGSGGRRICVLRGVPGEETGEQDPA
ncbi:MAG: hypothetical protein H0Z39_06975 [Peptococcaceae bacterium]|nr:hypothetical protein [Peptococcaceae bacterium]